MAKRKRSKGAASAAPAASADIPDKGRSRRVLVLSIAFLCLLCLIQFWGILSGGRNFWEDVAEGEFPARVFAKLAFFRGEFPHWNPFTFCGMPFFATGAGIFYPFNLLLSLLPVDGAALWYLIQAVFVLHVLIAGVCMRAYLLFRGRSNAAALFGAVSFMLGGYIVTHVIHSSVFYIAAWLPLMLLLLEKGVRDLKPVYVVIGGLLLGCVMQMGHAQVMFYAIVFMLTYALFLSCQYGLKKSVTESVPVASTTPVSPSGQSIKPLLRRVALSTLYFLIAAGLCMVQYLPIFEASGHTVRSRFTITDASQGSLQIAQLLTALIPKLFGAYTGSDGVPSFWLADAFQHGYYNYWESSFYVGVSTLILSLFAFRKIKTDRTAVFYASWILFSFLIALGGNFFFYKLLFNLGIPGFNSFRHTPRILFVWAFIFPVMAAAALDGLDALKSSKPLRVAALSLCAAAAVLGLITAAGGLKSVFPLMNTADGRARYASLQGMILLINAALFGTALILFFKNVVNEKRTKIVMLLCVTIDMLVFAAGQHITRRDGADVVFKRAQGTVETIKSLRKEGIYRVNTRQFIVEPGSKITAQSGFMLMNRNQGYVSEIEITEGYNQFRLKYSMLPLDAEKFNVMLDLMNIRYYVNPQFKEGDKDKDVMLRNETCLPRAKLFYKAAVVNGTNNGNSDTGADSLILDYMNGRNYDHKNEVVVTDPDLAKFTGGDGTGEAKIVKYDFNRIELDVDTDKEAILWLSEIWYPAWKATVNGNKTEVYKADYGFRVITVPAGKSKVVFKFDSTLFNIGALISLLTLLSSLTYLGLVFVKRKKHCMN